MKINLFILVFLLWVLVSLLPAQTGGDYDLSWNTYDCGGGASMSGPYSLIGTIGQPDSAILSGGDYTLQGGFWPGIPDTEFKPEGTFWFLY